MDLDSIMQALQVRLRGGRVVDPDKVSAARAHINDLEPGAGEGVEIRVELERPRDTAETQRHLDALRTLVADRWRTQLPEDFARLYSDYGRLIVDMSTDVMPVREFATRAEVLESEWLHTEAWSEMHSDGTTRIVWWPVIPFAHQGDGLGMHEYTAALGMWHADSDPTTSVQWLVPDLSLDDNGRLTGGFRGGFTAWLQHWFRVGFPSDFGLSGK